MSLHKVDAISESTPGVGVTITDPHFSYDIMAAPYSASTTGDATVAIQAAIVAAGVAGGGRVVVPAHKNFSVTQGGSGYALLIAYSNVWLEFEAGASLTMVTAASAGSCIQVNTVGSTTTLSNVRVTNAKVNANNSVDTQVVRLSGPNKNCVVSGCEIYGVSTASSNSASGIFIDGTFDSAKTVTSLTSASNVATATVASHTYAVNDYVQIWTANEPEYNGFHKITAVGGGGTTFSYIVPGLPVTPATGTITATKIFLAQDNEILDNYIHDIGSDVAPQAIYCYKTLGTIIRGNRCTKPGGRGIFIDGPNVGCVVGGNTVRDFGDNGIRINPSTNVTGSFIESYGHTVVGNIVDGGTRDGIRLNCVRTTCTGNTIRNVEKVGIKADVCQYSTISDNHCFNCGIDGISLYQTVTVIQVSGPHKSVMIHDNHCYNNAQFGINILGGGVSATDLAQAITIKDNQCYSNGAGGIAIADCDSADISGNFCFDNTNGLSSGTKPGIYVRMLNALTGGTRGIKVHHNRCFDTRGAGNRQGFGILIDSLTAGATLNGVVVEDNDVSDTPGSYGVRTFATAGTLGKVVVRRNKATNCATPFGLRTTDIGSGNQSTANLSDVSGSRGDANVTLVATIDEPTQRFATVFTANRTLTLTNTTYCTNGAAFRVIVTQGGAFTLTVQDSTPSTLKVVPISTNAFLDVVWDGSAWRLAAYGVL